MRFRSLWICIQAPICMIQNDSYRSGILYDCSSDGEESEKERGNDVMKVLGITGGIGSGKSEVLRMLGEKDGVVILEADRLAHELMTPGHTAYRRIVENFGREILAEDGSIDRGKMGQLVFRDPERLEQLNRIVHPAVKKSIRGRIRRNAEKGTAVYVIEAALLIQDGYRTICDEIWYVHTDPEVRIRRLLSSRGGNREKWEAVLANQPKDSFFVEHSDRVLENSRTVSELQKDLDLQYIRLLNS